MSLTMLRTNGFSTSSSAQGLKLGKTSAAQISRLTPYHKGTVYFSPINAALTGIQATSRARRLKPIPLPVHMFPGTKKIGAQARLGYRVRSACAIGHFMILPAGAKSSLVAALTKHVAAHSSLDGLQSLMLTSIVFAQQSKDASALQNLVWLWLQLIQSAPTDRSAVVFDSESQSLAALRASTIAETTAGGGWAKTFTATDIAETLFGLAAGVANANAEGDCKRGFIIAGALGGAVFGFAGGGPVGAAGGAFKGAEAGALAGELLCDGATDDTSRPEKPDPGGSGGAPPGDTGGAEGSPSGAEGSPSGSPSAPDGGDDTNEKGPTNEGSGDGGDGTGTDGTDPHESSGFPNPDDYPAPDDPGAFPAATFSLMTEAQASSKMGQLEAGVYHLADLPSFSSGLSPGKTTQQYVPGPGAATPVEEGSLLAFTTYRPISMGLLSQVPMYQNALAGKHAGTGQVGVGVGLG